MKRLAEAKREVSCFSGKMNWGTSRLSPYFPKMLGNASDVERLGRLRRTSSQPGASESVVLIQTL
jgi:hypothetical protein